MVRKKKPTKRHAPLVIGNWKMNPESVGDARKLFLEVRKALSRKQFKTYVAIAPPAPFISELERLSPSQRIKLSAQDVFYEKSGAFTGEISLSMLKSVGVSSVIIGHSERRAMGDSNEEIEKIIQAVVSQKMTAIVCVGELSRDAHGDYFTVVEEQIKAALKNIPVTKLKQLVVAYEPVWAIGTGEHATPEDVYEMKLFITKILSDLFGRKAITNIRFLYGGSVNADNAEDLLVTGNVDGFLVGGASLKPKEFISIIKTAETYVAN